MHTARAHAIHAVYGRGTYVTKRLDTVAELDVSYRPAVGPHSCLFTWTYEVRTRASKGERAILSAPHSAEVRVVDVLNREVSVTHAPATLLRRAFTVMPCAAILLLSAACANDITAPLPKLAAANGPSRQFAVVDDTLFASVSPDSVSLNVGDQQQLVAVLATIAGDPVDVSEVVWSSDNLDVADVSVDGVVTANGPGSANITVTLDGRSAVARVFVLDSLPPN